MTLEEVECSQALSLELVLLFLLRNSYRVFRYAADLLYTPSGPRDRINSHAEPLQTL